MSKTIAVIGIGSAGIQSLCHFLSFLDNSWRVVSIHDPATPIIGIGESTNESFATALEHGIDFNFLTDLYKLDGTIKFCTRWVDWRESPFTTPLLSGNIAMHFNTFKLAEFVLPRLTEKWGDKFEQHPGTVTGLRNDADKAIISMAGEPDLEADYVVDCSGFPKSYDGSIEVVDDLAVDRCLVHSIFDANDDWKYTLHQATPDGWMFGIPLTSRTTYGYLYHSGLTTDDEARRNFSAQLGGRELADEKKFTFRPFYDRQILDGRILKNGNKAIFFEPMAATSIFAYDMINRLLIDHILGGAGTDAINGHFQGLARRIMTQFYYMYGAATRYETPFWTRIRAIAKEKLDTPEMAGLDQRMTEFHYLKQGHSNRVDSSPLLYAARLLFRIDRDLGYNRWQLK